MLYVKQSVLLLFTLKIYLANQEAFYAVGDFSSNNTLTEIPLKAIINVGLSFESNQFTLKTSGAIWLFISLSNPNHQNFTIELMINKRSMKIISSSFLGYSNSLSVSWFSSVTKSDAIFLKSTFFSNITQAKVQFLGIHLDGTTMSPFVALAGETSFWYYKAAGPKEKFRRTSPSVILISRWNFTNHKVTIPLNGIYFVHTAAHAESCTFVFSPQINQTMCVVAFNLLVRSAGKQLDLLRLGKAYIGENSAEKNSVLSCSAMYRFSAGDEVIINLLSGEEQSTVAYHFVLYEPLHKNKIAFALYEKETNLPGKIRFSKVHVNEGEVWDSANYQVKIFVNGLYFVTLNAELNFTENYSVAVIRNNWQPIIEIDRIASEMPMPELLFQALSQAKLAELQLGDSLHVKTKTKCDETFFTGFLLYLF